ncbi:hypothetical protein DMA12_05335 [Amycolatopsis balhimycina DSM 5908]|uniref:Uncharacterized protein n=1 Tax=Amycolatopsis balhimycina DSM 5908 TaxID=1081091 RepID=A0A428X197_AMYBA|nr:CDP-glycerol glycerophosphotransferase family protein [Amycolatopsis balhimycina]RSM49135.1 hypothetical protein DMA12_05335 [Amycolatopsis balhimycina DSM 5908]
MSGRRGGGLERRTLRAAYSVLVVVRTFTTVDRLRTILETLFPDAFEVKFTVERGSVFADRLVEYLRELEFEVLDMRRARRMKFDVILAAHATAALGKLNGPVIVCPHGAGYNRRVRKSSGCDRVATGLVESQLTTRFGRVIPEVVFVSHEEQRERLRKSSPKAAERAIVLGDPVLDRIFASEARRERYRRQFGVGADQKLVVVTSTWGPYGTVGCEASLPKRLLAQLPADEYKVLLIMHPNIWSGHSPALIKLYLREELDSGLVIVPPRSPWEAGLIAADLVIGDHSSLSIYAAALGRRFLLAADGSPELVPGSPLERLCAEAPRLDPAGDLLEQIEGHLWSVPRRSGTEIADLMFQERGRSWHIFRSVVRKVVGLPELAVPPRVTPVDDPRPATGREVTAWTVSTTSSPAGTTGSATVGIRRYPRLAGDGSDEGEDDLQVSDYGEADERCRLNSEIIVRSEMLSRAAGEQWLVEMLPSSPKYGHNAGLLAYRHSGGCVLAWRDGPRIEAGTQDAFAAAVVLHRMRQDGWPLDKPGTAEYHFGAAEPASFPFGPAPA